ncbi:competence type IV pilus minor pilin ComGE [Listeria ivanovii]|uniref:Type II secretion system protein n=1 Tax=Listeria ivanovii subsp. londoniensis TaxID=202752 RepID=A0ABS1G4S3_LISIV|nr:competence type IV pilus minor pilin ComGE [Listeria ivanovii]AIS59738.1 competence protein ComG [Listeria ivanovii subsp. londoniensis]AIS62573.1 competence protein ComG [Listeria ivanovii subsp. londoniensis]MBC2254136.1 type II secretion system protein [Listeria ivanovii]MBK1961750.1 type II secretion system protein [Listeria ivanovii subsp. londoniensis]MBK1964961.1 type II secretion system protein [Listeria ivanovii subsp. londoniensis]
MNRINGFSLVESMVSLLLFSLVCSFLLPLTLTIFQRIEQEKELSTLHQQLFEHSELLLHGSIPINFNDNQLKSYHENGGIQICAKNKRTEKCIL